jgi:hypothetical protein
MRYIGVDLHSNSITVYYLTESGKEALNPPLSTHQFHI